MNKEEAKEELKKILRQKYRQVWGFPKGTVGGYEYIAIRGGELIVIEYFPGSGNEVHNMSEKEAERFLKKFKKEESGK